MNRGVNKTVGFERGFLVVVREIPCSSRVSLFSEEREACTIFRSIDRLEKLFVDGREETKFRRQSQVSWDSCIHPL